MNIINYNDTVTVGRFTVQPAEPCAVSRLGLDALVARLDNAFPVAFDPELVFKSSSLRCTALSVISFCIKLNIVILRMNTLI